MDFTEDGMFRVGGEGGGIFNNAISGLGQLSMAADTAAKLQACTAGCDAKYGVPSGHPDVFQLTACFANCNLTYPPTMATPSGGQYTPPPVVIPSAPPPGAQPQFSFPLLNLPTPPGLATPPQPGAPVPVQAGMSTNTKLGLAVLGLAVAGGIGYAVYKSRQGGGAPKAKMAENRVWNASSRRMVGRKR